MSAAADAATAANALIDARVVPNTKKKYKGYVASIANFYTEHLHRTLTLPVDKKDIELFFGWLTQQKRKGKSPAFSTVRQYKSALKWYYKEQSVLMEPLVDQSIELLLRGYRRSVSQKKLDGELPSFEGKYHITFDGYCLIARALFTSTTFSNMLFGWPFLVLQWNLLCRSATVSNMMMEHIGWEGDSLLISTPKTKADQEGIKCFARHLYANPTQPVICPVLALAIVTFTRVLKHDPRTVHNHSSVSLSSVSTGSSSSDTDPDAAAALPNYRIFDGPSSEKRFCDMLHRTIASMPASDVSRLGGEKHQLGTHSVRKGAASYCTGLINGPSTVQVFLRAGWSLGNVQDRYLFAGAGGDQLTGRVLSGLSFNDGSFAALPPHFTDQGLVAVNWPAILPHYDRVPEIFKRALPYLLASICFHREWLRSSLPSDHPLFGSPLFASGTVIDLKRHVIAGCTRCVVTGMAATGIPSHLAMSNELIAVAKQTEMLKESILTKCTELPTELVNVMLSKFSVNGAIPVTVDDIKALLNNALSQLRVDLRDNMSTTQLTTFSSAPLSDPASDPRFQYWLWGGKMHMVPQDWQFPSTDVKATWHLYHLGHVEDRIRPLRYLKKFDLTTRSNITRWSKANGVMKAVGQMMVETGTLQSLDAVLRMSAEESSAAFDAAIVQLMEKLKQGSTQGKGRWMEMSVSTLYDLLCKAKAVSGRKRKLDEQQQRRQQQEQAAGEAEEAGSSEAE